MVIFAVHNVVCDPPFKKMDLITCRNLLIYFECAQQEEVLSLFHYCLRDGRYLILGKSETNLWSVADKFETCDSRLRIFKRIAGASSWNMGTRHLYLSIYYN